MHNAAIHSLLELKKAFRGFDWANQTPSSQNALIRAISVAIAHGEALEAERQENKRRAKLQRR